MKKLISLFTLLVYFTTSYSQTLDPAYLIYIENFKEIAIKQHQKHGIPASIILAQGLLESGAGRGRLAVEANNHFGIKCHDWTGKKIYHDDDEKTSVLENTIMHRNLTKIIHCFCYTDQDIKHYST